MFTLTSGKKRFFKPHLSNDLYLSIYTYIYIYISLSLSLRGPFYGGNMNYCQAHRFAAALRGAAGALLGKDQGGTNLGSCGY